MKKSAAILKRHIRDVHLVERPFSCKYCTETFSQNSSLTKHIIRHHQDVFLHDFGRRLQGKWNHQHVFVENGKEVEKMPVLINKETVWVECVPNSPTVEQQEAEIMMELGAEDAGDCQTGPAVKIISTPQ